MIKKYLKVIEFHQDSDRKDQVQLARKEIQNIFHIYDQMNFYLNYDFTDYQNNAVIQEVLKQHSYYKIFAKSIKLFFSLDLSKPKTLRRIIKVKGNKVKDLFESILFYNLHIDL